MPYILDTCSLSEFVAPEPSPIAVEHMIDLPRDEIYLSVTTIGEIQQGISEMQPGKRKSFLEQWLEDHVLLVYAERIIAIDVPIARRWGILAADLKDRGSKMQVKDSLIAATALVHDLTVVTRNESDFAHCGTRVFNPWK